jgi:hypothetical protein
MNTPRPQSSVTVEIELPPYTRKNLLRRDWVVAETMRAADRIAPGNFIERVGIGGDELYTVRVADAIAAVRLRLENQRIVRESYRDDLDLDHRDC